MKLFKQALFGISIFSVGIVACNSDKKAEGLKSVTVKGLYAFGPDMKSFTLCEDGREFWVIDSVKELELDYSNLGFEKPYEPVYVELEGHYVKSDTLVSSADYDSTLVVTKVVKISKDIPDGPCSQ
jgi:copper homeostasis protein (lipoprotein)